MKSLTLFIALISILFINSACGVPAAGGGGSSLSGGGGSNGSGGSGSATASGGGAHGTAEGTITSGGGNTLDGKMTERYSQDIEKLPEYVHIIVPQLRKLSQQHADVFVAYLQWVATNKAWYFVPVKLPSLPKERIALAFQSDQLALHSDKEIFIDKDSYAAESEQERAFLLMHEMVMGAKLLMKKTPQQQCAILNGVLDPGICSDPTVLKSAVTEPTDVNSKDPEAILNGHDHESVRAMTIFLMDKNQTLEGSRVAAKRRQLDFTFPWDGNLSQITLQQTLDALQRSTLAEETFKAITTIGTVDPTECYLKTFDFHDHWSIVFGTGRYAGESGDQSATFTQNWWIPSGATIPLEARGVLDPTGTGQLVDLVEILPNAVSSGGSRMNMARSSLLKMQFYISRGATPHLIEYRAIPVAERSRTVYQHGLQTDELEFIEIKSQTSLRCQVQN